ncbi:TPM domain-containing protein [Pseudorhodoplanes sp.]|uniref:TPM domain-containing protein n=1 Tax=Pseudorhodoplanes sp. TaxID=1934341 RepID=UPI002CB5C88C|nr:TPM domain-containing protein [Pseudorhodoplanes sp.]HWV54911.1 TPM domain-containing protein [Pseudorhodoplanes sp.]
MLVSRPDKDRISAVIAAVEHKTSGEIFCVIARQCGDYRTIPLIWAAAFALLLPLPLILLSPMRASWIYMLQLAVFAIASVILSIPAIRFHIVPRRSMQQQAHAEAVRQFLAQGLHKTENRTGVLIFASEAEHYAEVIADEGINEKVPQQVWDEAIAVLIAAIARGRPADGFVGAVERCGAVLAQHFPPGALNRNELPDKLIEI